MGIPLPNDCMTRLTRSVRVPDILLPAGVKLGVAGSVPTFVGYYWLTGTPGVQGQRTAVLDFGAGKDGPLVAYRWSGEDQLVNQNIVFTEA